MSLRLKRGSWSEDDPRRGILNVNGSAIPLHHPIGATFEAAR